MDTRSPSGFMSSRPTCCTWRKDRFTLRFRKFSLRAGSSPSGAFPRRIAKSAFIASRPPAVSNSKPNFPTMTACTKQFKPCSALLRGPSMNEFFRRLRYLLHRRRLDQELASDLEFHGEMAAREGRHLGNTLRLREEARDAWGWTWIDRFSQDFRY